MWPFKNDDTDKSINSSEEYCVVWNSLYVAQDSLKKLIEKRERSKKFNNHYQCESYELELLMINVFLMKISQLINNDSIYRDYQISCRKIDKLCISIDHLNNKLNPIIDQKEEAALKKIGWY